MEGLVVSEAKLKVVVRPSMSNRIPEAVLQELSSHLFQFNEIFGGVLLSYDIQIVGKEAPLLQDIHPYVRVGLTGKLLIFSPKTNMFLEGTVVKLTPESIHVVVLGFASTVIVDGDIREELEYVSSHDGEVYRSKFHKRHVIKVGTILRFQVKSLDEEIIHISGSLAAAGTGSVKWLEKRNVETQMLDRKLLVGGKNRSIVIVLKDPKEEDLQTSCNGSSKCFSSLEEGYLTYDMIEWGNITDIGSLIIYILDLMGFDKYVSCWDL